MKTLDDWFDAYGESHQNSTNKLIHWICVPLIFWSILALLSTIPLGGIPELFSENIQPHVHLGTLVVIVGLGFYLRYSITMSLGILLFSLFCLYDIQWLRNNEISVLYTSLIVFVLAWIGQFIGHKIEGKKPSFFEDLKFLMIGPAWLIHFIYKKVGIKY